MSKKFRGKPCTYCAERAATQPDHVFAREFFLVNRRGNLPKVPACQTCNHEKSKLEHYLLTVLPFGGNHPDAIINLSEMGPRRLAKNVRLHQQIRIGQTRSWAQFGNLVLPSMTIPIDSSKIDALFRYIVRGVLRHHRQVLLGPDAGVWAGILSKEGERVFRQMLSLNGHRITENLGKQTFVYEGVQTSSDPEMSVWLFSVYGGLILGGDPNEPEPKATVIGGITANLQALAKFLELMRTQP